MVTRAGTYWRLPTPNRTAVPRAHFVVLSPLQRSKKAAVAPCSNAGRKAVEASWRTWWRPQPLSKPPGWPSEFWGRSMLQCRKRRKIMQLRTPVSNTVFYTPSTIMVLSQRICEHQEEKTKHRHWLPPLRPTQGKLKPPGSNTVAYWPNIFCHAVHLLIQRPVLLFKLHTQEMQADHKHIYNNTQ